MLSIDECLRRVQLCRAHALAASDRETRAIWLSLIESYQLIVGIEETRGSDGQIGAVRRSLPLRGRRPRA